MSVRYWQHPESEAYFTTESETEAEDAARECDELTAEEYAERTRRKAPLEELLG